MPGPGSPENLLEMQTLRTHPGPGDGVQHPVSRGTSGDSHIIQGGGSQPLIMLPWPMVLPLALQAHKSISCSRVNSERLAHANQTHIAPTKKSFH